MTKTSCITCLIVIYDIYQRLFFLLVLWLKLRYLCKARRESGHLFVRLKYRFSLFLRFP